MDSKYTPGPWGISRSAKGDIGVCASRYAPGYTGPEMPVIPICNLEQIDNLGRIFKASEFPNWVRPVPGETEANAQLIACAPELFEILEALVKEYDETNFDVVGKDEALIHRAKAVLAKATGGQQHG